MTAVQFQFSPVSSRANAVPAGRLRLTRRGRLVIGTLSALPLIAVLVAFAALGTTSAEASSATGAATTAFTYVTVGAGQDLWGVAQSLEPIGDIRDVVADIVNLNRLESSSVQPGQRLAIPAAYAR
jgi:hypothetical protein